ncbi:MAG: CoA transferase, partial [Alphaproteobacteria bacterium]|nr:CoA transferase [Alphaproteobacteria bacterium]
MAGALEGLRVIDFTTNLSGPYCAMLLADQGADVIKVERPEGEAMRQTPPFVAGESAPFMLWNRNKRSVTLDLKSDDGFQAAWDLCATADIVVENFRPGVMARLGLGYEALAAENPGLVMTSISGFGQDGPYGTRGGFDLITQAMSGLAAINGPEDGPPFRLPIAISDVGAGMFGAYATMVAIHGRTQTGKGQHVDVSLYE